MGVRFFTFPGLVACLLLVVACGGGEAAPADASIDTVVDSAEDAVDAGAADSAVDTLPPFDAGPPSTGCELLGDGGAADADTTLAPPAPDSHLPLPGPGGPTAAFDAAELYTSCAFLDGGETDRDHHNTVLMWDGYLWMPFAHEAGRGGIAVFDFSDACAPVPLSVATSEQMRETHAAGLATIDGRRFMAVTSLSGVQFWDVSDPMAMRLVSDLALPDVVYPDSYARVVMSVFWQAPFVYVGAADNGVFVVDATDPENPELVHQFRPTPTFRVGGVHAVGTALVVFPSEGTRTQFFDIGDPLAPRPMPGGAFGLTNGEMDRRGRPVVRAGYFAHLNGDRAYYAQHLIGGGLIVYDVADFSAPRVLGFRESPDFGANGGYVFIKEDMAYVGLSGFAEIMDVSDPSAIERVARIDTVGDVDTMVPIGNIVVVSVDDDAIPGQASAVQPVFAAPDTRAPAVNMVVPRDGEGAVALGARVGVSFTEFVELGTVFSGSFYLREVGTEAPLAGQYSGQEGIVNFAPARPLRPATEYELVLPAGGVEDYSGNATDVLFRSTFTTVDCGAGG